MQKGHIYLLENKRNARRSPRITATNSPSNERETFSSREELLARQVSKSSNNSILLQEDRRPSALQRRFLLVQDEKRPFQNDQKLMQRRVNCILNDQRLPREEKVGRSLEEVKRHEKALENLQKVQRYRGTTLDDVEEVTKKYVEFVRLKVDILQRGILQSAEQLQSAANFGGSITDNQK